GGTNGVLVPMRPIRRVEKRFADIAIARTLTDMKTAFALAACALLAVIRLGAEQPAYATLPLGSPAPDFNVPGMDGQNYSLKDFAGAKILAVIFTCTHCPTAQYYEERIKKLVGDYQD